MAVAYNRKEVKIKDITSDIIIPENDIARLMYYLYSLDVVLKLDSIEYGSQKLRDYKNFHELTKLEVQEVIKLCSLLSPDKLEGKCIFHSEEMCKDVKYTNRFLQVDSTETAFAATFAATDTVFVGSVEVSVKKIMAYQTAWLNKYYIDPMDMLVRGVYNTRSNTMITTSTVVPFNSIRNTTRNNDNWVYTSNSESLDCCIIL